MFHEYVILQLGNFPIRKQGKIQNLLFNLLKLKLLKTIKTVMLQHSFLLSTRDCVSTQCIPGRDIVKA